MPILDNNKSLFKFNLLPPKTAEELEAIAKQRRSIIMAVSIPLMLLALTGVIALIDFIAVQPVKSGWESAVSGLEADLASSESALGRLKVVNGELKIKTDYIAEPVSRNVDFSNIFAVVEKAFSGNSTNSQVTSYGREDSGQFQVNAISSQIDGPTEILAKFRQDTQVNDVELKSVSHNIEKGEYRFTIGFSLGISQTNS